MQIIETHQFKFDFTVQDMPFNFTLNAASEKGAIELLKAILIQIQAELSAGKGAVVIPADVPPTKEEPGE